MNFKTFELNNVIKRELMVVGVLAVVLVVSIVPALLHSRAEVRDGVLRDGAGSIKRQMEMENNELGYYPANFVVGAPYEFSVTQVEGSSAIGWEVRVKLENRHTAQSGYDYEEGRNYYYRIDTVGNDTYYVVCGGENICGAERREE